MSFKRDGDDQSLLKNLNHQRVRELLGSHIPQDEAKLLSNGRLTCTICYHRPIFDTINMLAAHRKGKKHLLELSKYIKCKEDAEIRALKKRTLSKELSEKKTDKVRRVDVPSILHSNTVLGVKHVVFKPSSMKYQRKSVLEVQPVLPPVASVKSCELEAKKITKTATATVRHYLKSISRKSSLEKKVEKNRENYGIDLQMDQSSFKDTNSPYPSKELRISASTATSATQPVSTSKCENQDHELKLRMSGWIKDLSGKWIKDPNVEFDSDEEESPPLPPT